MLVLGAPEEGFADGFQAGLCLRRVKGLVDVFRDESGVLVNDSLFIFLRHGPVNVFRK